jgi:putative membrane protein insertion efficiency factor
VFTPVSYLFIGLIKVYQYTISPMLPMGCRFQPSCSQYGVEAFKKHGLFKGLYLTGKRISKCHPWGAHGHDPVP